MTRPQALACFRFRFRRPTARDLRRRGMVAVHVALCLVPLCGVTAFAIDGGMMMEYRRRVQAAADAAALAAAAELYRDYATNSGADPNGSASACATTSASDNGFSTASTLTVNIPPASGPFQGKLGYAEVVLQYNMPRGFSSILGSGSLPIKARSVARGQWSPFNNGILLLDPTSSGSLSDSGNGTVIVSGANIVIDSSSATAASASGNATITAPEIVITGRPGDVTSGHGKFVGAIDSGADPTVDPLLYLPAPDPSAMPTVMSSKYSLPNGMTVLTPGVYVGGISLSGNASAVLLPGIYYLKGGGFSMSGNGSLTAPGVMFYNDPGSSGGAISITGNGSVTISPPLSGTYKGISVFQNRTATTSVSITGNGGMNMIGTLYVPHARLNVSGNGSNNIVGSQYISYDLSVSGNGLVSVVWTAATTANARSFGLVE